MICVSMFMCAYKVYVVENEKNEREVKKDGNINMDLSVYF